MSCWTHSVVEALDWISEPISTVIETFYSSKWNSYITDARLLLSCMLRDNILSLPKRLLAIALLIAGDKDTVSSHSKFLYQLFDILDVSESKAERWTCFYAINGLLYKAPMKNYSINDIVNNIDSFIEKHPVTDEVAASIEVIKRDYYREQLSSPEMLPFMSFDSSCFVTPDYPQLDVHLPEYASDFEAHQRFMLVYSPEFDRPALDFEPSREELWFVPPSLVSPSLLYAPVDKLPQKEEEIDWSRLWSEVIPKEDFERMMNDNSAVTQISEALSEVSAEDKAKHVEECLDLNLDLCKQLSQKYPTEELTRLLLLQPKLTLHNLDYASWLVSSSLASKSLLVEYVKHSVQSLCKMKDCKHLLKCFCVFVVGQCKLKHLDESMIHDDLIDLKHTFPSQLEIEYTLHKLYGKGD